MKITNREDREKRDWGLLIFIIPVGIFLMMIAGQIAIRIVPNWSVAAGMQSSLDLDSVPNQQVELIQPILPDILTPMSWFDTYLIPNSNSGDNVVFPPFIVFEASASPSPESTTSATAAASETSTIPATTVSSTPTVAVTPPATKTKKPPVDTPSPIATTPSPTATTPSPTATSVPSTPDPSYTLAAVPVQLGTGTPDGNAGNIAPGKYVVLNISGSPIYVGSTPDGYYDLIYYESVNGGSVWMDHVIVGISEWGDFSLPGSVYYEVFNWGDNNRDTNTNVDTNNLPPDPGCVASPPECDDRIIPTSDLYPSPGGTGILIDVDNASSLPPPNALGYNYIVIISPNTGKLDPAQVDAIQITEVPIPTPIP